MQNKPSKNSQIVLKFCQSGEISPNLVTLIPIEISGRVHLSSTLLRAVWDEFESNRSLFFCLLISVTRLGDLLDFGQLL